MKGELQPGMLLRPTKEWQFRATNLRKIWGEAMELRLPELWLNRGLAVERSATASVAVHVGTPQMSAFYKGKSPPAGSSPSTPYASRLAPGIEVDLPLRPRKNPSKRARLGDEDGDDDGDNGSVE